MKIKLKIFLLLIPILIFLSNTNYASVDTAGKNFALHNKAERRKTGYYFVTTTNSVKPIAKIVQTNNQGTVEKVSNNGTGIYSIKNGTGISSANNTQKVEKYNQYFDWGEYRRINNAYKSNLPSDINTYNALAWIMNNMCIPENDLSKQALLASAGLEANIFKKYEIEKYNPEDIEKDIIESIQQSAIWYYTNQVGEYHPTDYLQLYVSNDLTNAINLSEMNLQNGESPINKLYRYLIDGAKTATENGYNYQNEIAKSPIIFNKEGARAEVYGENYVIGPYNISLAQANCTLNVSISDGKSEIRDVKLLGEDSKQELVGNNINDKIVSNLGKNFYISVPTTTSANSINIKVDTNYNTKKITYWSTNANTIRSSEPIVFIKNESKKNSEFDSKSILKTSFDLALRQFVNTVNDVKPEKSREPEYKKTDLKDLAEGKSTLDSGTTLVKKTKKNGLSVATGDKVLLTIRVYNEGQISGNADMIVEFLPEGLEFIEDSEINKEFKWNKYEENSSILISNYLSDKELKPIETVNEDEYKVDYKDINLECRVKSTTQTTDTSLKAIAEIISSSNLENTPDRDSNINSLTGEQRNDYNPGTSSEGKGYEDDDDYEEIIVVGKYFDLALKTFISEVQDTTGNMIQYEREPKVDVSPILGGGGTANYNGSKSPVSVEAGDIITYTIRIYNEGQIDGYVDEIMHHLPEDLEYVNDEFNAKNGWIIDTTDVTQRTLKSTLFSKENDEDNIIKSFDNQSDKLNYKELKLKCKVKSTAPALREITSVTEINKSSNSANLADRDNKSNVSIPSDKDLENYRGNESNKAELSDSNYYYKGQEDDDDFDKIILEKFDFALRYFITDVNGKEITDRIPEVDTSNYGENVDNKLNTTFNYNHNKEAIKVCKNDIITYTIRVYNEGTQDGYAAQIGNNIPEGMEFIPDNETNQKYSWKMYDQNGKKTDDIEKATYLKSNYLARKESDEENKNLIKAFNSEEEFNYKDIKVSLRVKNSKPEGDRTVISQAQIIKTTDADGGKVSDIDSSPNSWQDGEDDQDEEKIYIKIFDLSLNMKVDEVMTIEEGQEKANKTESTSPNSQDSVINVSITDKDLENTIIKYKFLIEITNEGEIDGTASEITDFLPDGLKFNQADNVKWKEKDGLITTNQLKTQVIKPGETKTVDIILTWNNEESNIGVKTNIAEITEVLNESNSEDNDSNPNNKEDAEDDIKSASVAITAVAGEQNKKMIIIGGIAIVLVIVGIGVLLIRKYVL
ncbi:MAG: Cys-Gln thioester bond-forming surface protein [Clostridia bacterium]|nr:Cys-Gln thioester bond-forming surface protein [Clostridia bacterium]